MRVRVVLLVVALAACGGDAAPGSTAAPATSGVETTSTIPAATTATTVAPTPPAVLALSSGRGDDDTFEATVWFASDPFVGDDYRVVVGADVEGGYPGVGDPFPFLNGHLELTPAGAVLMVGSDVLAEGDAIGELVSWGYAEGALRVFFIDTTPARGGTTWVIVEVDGERVPFGTAGAAFGTACSYQSAGTGLTASGVPDAGAPCRYP